MLVVIVVLCIVSSDNFQKDLLPIIFILSFIVLVFSLVQSTKLIITLLEVQFACYIVCDYNHSVQYSVVQSQCKTCISAFLICSLLLFHLDSTLICKNVRLWPQSDSY